MVGWAVGFAVAPCEAATIAGTATSPPVIAVDVGHSLAKPGATSARGVSEFQFNRVLAVAVQDALRARGFQTRLIGENGESDVLTDRTMAASEAGADLFLSIHHDSVQPHYLEAWIIDGREMRYSDRFSGYSLFVSRKNPLPERSLACAQAIGAALRRDGASPSLHHAEPIKGENRPFADAERGVYYFDDLVVLKTATMPAVLIEAGIIVNRQDELVLRQGGTQRALAAAISSGVAACVGAFRGPARSEQGR